MMTASLRIERLEGETPPWWHALPMARLRAGRLATLEVALDHPGISRRHALFFPGQGGWFLRDLNSEQGTFLNDRRIPPETDIALHDGDLVRLADGPVLRVLIFERDESWWRTCQTPCHLWHAAEKAFTERKMRLFLTACCRSVWADLPDPRSRAAVEVMERFADGRAARDDLDEAARRATDAISAADLGVGFTGQYCIDLENWNLGPSHTYPTPAGVVAQVTAVPELAGVGVDWFAIPLVTCAAACELLRDLLAPPFRQPGCDPRWLTPNVAAVARSIYDTSEFGDMPILGDALEEAGCTDAALLDHCRTTVRHVRGCFVLDQILGKA